MRTLKVLLTIVGLAVGAWLLPTSVGGATSFVTTHGISMAPRFHAGDLAVVRASGDYQIGDVAAYHSRTLATVVMHRIVAINDGLYTFKGDNNEFLDPEKPSRDQLIGTLRLRIPRGGIWMKRLTSPSAVGAYAFLLLAGGGTAVQRRHRRRRATVSRHAGPSRRRPGPPALWTPQLLMGAAAVAAVGVLGVALGLQAWTSPTSRQTTTRHPSSQSMAFSYSTKVARTPAYDRTTVTSPDPVFRSLARTVTVRFAYRGRPGHVAVDAELSTAGGWHTTVPLAALTPTVGNRYRGEVVLHLAAIEHRAAAAAAITKIPFSEIAIDVVPQVVTADGKAWKPTLELSLTPLQLSLAEPSGPLTIASSTTVTRTVTTPRAWTFANHAITVGAARTLSVVLLVLALLTGFALAVVARVTAPVDELARIKQRYRTLLVTVAPVQPSATQAVVDVTDIATLARLADRFGTLILHWSENGQETFLVEDQGSVYRYREGTAPRPRRPRLVAAG